MKYLLMIFLFFILLMIIKGNHHCKYTICDGYCGQDTLTEDTSSIKLHSMYHFIIKGQDNFVIDSKKEHITPLLTEEAAREYALLSYSIAFKDDPAPKIEVYPATHEDILDAISDIQRKKKSLLHNGYPTDENGIILYNKLNQQLSTLI